MALSSNPSSIKTPQSKQHGFLRNNEYKEGKKSVCRKHYAWFPTQATIK
jgi:hypothetical protein